MMTQQLKLSIVFSLWIIYLILLNIISWLPHSHLHLLSWINYSLYFLLGIFCLNIAQRDHYLWDIFVFFSLTFLFVSFTFLVYFLGDNGVVGTEMLKYSYFIYSRLISHLLYLISITYFVMRYLFWKSNQLHIIYITIFLAVLILFPLLIHIRNLAEYSMSVGTITIMHYLLRIDYLSLVIIFLYFLLLFLTGRPNGAFLNFWALGIFIAVSFDTFDMLFTIRKIDVYGFDQYFTTFSLSLLLVILFLRLLALHSESHLMREKLLFDKKFSPSTAQIFIKYHQSSILLQILKSFVEDKIKLVQLALSFSILLLSGLSRSPFVMMKIMLLFMIILASWNLYYHVLRMRLKRGQILNKKFFIKP